MRLSVRPRSGIGPFRNQCRSKTAGQTGGKRPMSFITKTLGGVAIAGLAMTRRAGISAGVHRHRNRRAYRRLLRCRQLRVPHGPQRGRRRPQVRPKARHTVRSSVDGRLDLQYRPDLSGELDFGVAQSDWQFHAVNGSRPDRVSNCPDLRAVFLGSRRALPHHRCRGLGHPILGRP